MPLHVLAILVVFGLAAIIGVVHFSGGSKDVLPLSVASAMARFVIDFPEFKISDGIASEDGKCVLLLSENSDRAGLVVQMGCKSLTRLVSTETLSGIVLDDSGLEIALRDFTLPLVQLKSDQVDEIHRAEDYLDNLKGALA